MLAPIYSCMNTEQTYPQCVHLLHAPLQHRHRLRYRLGNILSTVGRLELSRECAHLDSEALQVEGFLSIPDHGLSEDLGTIHVALVQRLRYSKCPRVLRQRSSCARAFLAAPSSATGAPSGGQSSWVPLTHQAGLASSIRFPLKSKLLLSIVIIVYSQYECQTNGFLISKAFQKPHWFSHHSETNSTPLAPPRFGQTALFNAESESEARPLYELAQLTKWKKANQSCFLKCG